LTEAVTDDASRSRPHGLVAKALHWGTAGLLLFAYIDNGDVTGALRDPASMRFEALVGLGVVAAFAARFLWMQRWNGGATRLPASAPWWEQRLSRLAHHSLYLCVAAIVASGLLIWGAQSFAGSGLVRAAADLHEFITGATLFVIGGHIAAALWHKLVRRDGVWESIGTPWWQPRSGWSRKVRG
jgi:cytochrome b561